VRETTVPVIEQGAVWVKGANRFPVKKHVIAKMFIGYLNREVVGTASSATGEMICFDWGMSSVCLAIGHEELNNLVWLDENAGEKDEWIRVEDRLPTESGRYWCYVEEITDLGRGYFQWNCAYSQNGKIFTDRSLCNGERITHWRPLPEPPKRSPEL
jgi:hypothetical protein